MTSSGAVIPALCMLLGVQSLNCLHVEVVVVFLALSGSECLLLTSLGCMESSAVLASGRWDGKGDSWVMSM